MSRQTLSKSMSIDFGNILRTRARRSEFIPYAALATSCRRTNSLFRFKSMLSRIMFLHIAAMVMTAIVMALMLYWLFSADVENLQQGALREQTESLAHHLVLRPDASWSFDLPAGL